MLSGSARPPFLTAALVSFLALAPPALPAPDNTEYGVYLRLVEAPPGSFAQMTAAVPAALDRAGWRLLASYDAATGGCKYSAKVFVVYPPAYASQVLERGVRAAFALPVRLAAFEDERGVHLAVANPQSLARTIVADTGFDAPPAELVAALRRLTSTGFPGKPVAEQYGQIRTKGHIDRTMGIVAGGSFASKIETGLTVKNRSPAELAGRLEERTREVTGRWGLRVIYRQDLPDQHAVLVGLAGAAIESRAFAIVGSGTDESRKSFACPGLDHAAAFPIELLLVQEAGETKVLLVDAMFRMKLYFEDAGKMKFAANMQMPGSIEDEIRDLLEEIGAAGR